MGEATTQETEEFSRLEHLPVTFFAVLMGLFGLALALYAAAGSFAWAGGPARAAVWLGLAGFAVIGGGLCRQGGALSPRRGRRVAPPGETRLLSDHHHLASADGHGDPWLPARPRRAGLADRGGGAGGADRRGDLGLDQPPRLRGRTPDARVVHPGGGQRDRAACGRADGLDRDQLAVLLGRHGLLADPAGSGLSTA